MGSVALARRRTWTVDDYQAMRAAGVLTEDDRVELLDGEVVRKVVIGPRHTAGTLTATAAPTITLSVADALGRAVS